MFESLFRLRDILWAASKGDDGAGEPASEPVQFDPGTPDGFIDMYRRLPQGLIVYTDPETYGRIYFDVVDAPELVTNDFRKLLQEHRTLKDISRVSETGRPIVIELTHKPRGPGIEHEPAFYGVVANILNQHAASRGIEIRQFEPPVDLPERGINPDRQL